MRVAGLVTVRQHPVTAKGYVFVLMEDEHGPINVIIKPDIYQRDRSAVRMEPFLTVRGRLQKDGASLNVIAFEVTALQVDNSPAGPPPRERTEAARRVERSWEEQDSVRRGAGRNQTGERRDAGRSQMGDLRGVGRSEVGERRDAGGSPIGELQETLPGTEEYWAGMEKPGPTPFSYLTALRQSPPGVKHFG